MGAVVLRHWARPAGTRPASPRVRGEGLDPRRGPHAGRPVLVAARSRPGALEERGRCRATTATSSGLFTPSDLLVDVDLDQLLLVRGAPVGRLAPPVGLTEAGPEREHHVGLVADLVDERRAASGSRSGADRRPRSRPPQLVVTGARRAGPTARPRARRRRRARRRCRRGSAAAPPPQEGSAARRTSADAGESGSVRRYRPGSNTGAESSNEPFITSSGTVTWTTPGRP